MRFGNFKKDGFEGQRAIVVPKAIINKFCIDNPLINRAFITDIGYYPKAKFHYRERPLGAEQNILIYCLEGMGNISLDRKKFSIGPGDFFVIPHHMAHTYETDVENPWTIYWCHFKGEQADEIIRQIYQKNGAYKSSIPFMESRITLFNKLYQNLEKGYSYDNLSYINLIFPQFLSSFLFPDRFVVSPNEADEGNIIERSIRFMQENLHTNLTLAGIAKEVNSSPSHYSAVFKKKTGFPPIEYLNHLKIQKACQYLQFTELRVKEIAIKIGIEDQYYFSRLFHKTMGFSPSQYRSQKVRIK